MHGVTMKICKWTDNNFKIRVSYDFKYENYFMLSNLFKEAVNCQYSRPSLIDTRINTDCWWNNANKGNPQVVE
jgi:hypothetical protein